MTTAPDHASLGIKNGSAHSTGDEFKGLLAEVMSRFAEADQRNEQLLREMHGQLESLRTQARDSRPAVPVPYRPGFERIEDGMALLAVKIAETYAARSSGADAPAPATAYIPALDQDAPSPPLAFEPASAPISDAFAALQPLGHSAMDAGNQPPLRSSAAGLAHPPRFGKLSSNVDTFDVIESVPGNPAEPWSQEEVAALNEIYSSRDMLFSAASLKSEPDTLYRSEPRPDAASAILPQAPPSFDQAWLDGRLAEIANLIIEGRPVVPTATAIGALGERFAALEMHMSEALRGMARVEDFGALGEIERHIADLTAKIELVHADMARFDMLEHRLGAIETSVEAGLGATNGNHSAADIHAVAISAAEAAAGRVAQQAVRDQSRSQGEGRISDIHEMLVSYMAERRQGDEQTSAILDTLQQAMVHLLDRVDSRGLSDGQPQHALTHGANASGGNAAGMTPAHDMFAAPARELSAHEADDHFPDQSEAGHDTAVQSMPATEPEKFDDLADPIARQRASLQMSAQRAAMAQREKQAAQEAKAAPKGKDRDKSSGAKTKAASGWARLMVRGLVLAVAVGAGAGAVSTLMPVDGALTTARLKSAVSPASLALTEQSASEQSLASVTGEITQPPEAVNSSVSSVISNDKPKPPPIMGIMIQDQQPPAGQSAAAGRATSDTSASGGLKVSAAAGDAIPGINSAEGGDEPKSNLGLPPATVGPVSLRLAAGNGDPSAEFEVASRLAEGKGTDQNLALATRWYQRAASKGFVQAQYRLGTLYERGLGVTKDLNRARSWYQRAAEQGNVKSMHNLAVLAAGRSGLAPDYETAVKWFKSAAQNGLADSQFNLAVLTESGLGVAKDKVEAAQWYIIAARSGDRESIRRRDALRAQLTKAELSRADDLVAAWQPLMPDRLANDQTAAGQAWKSRQPGASAPDNG